MIVPTLNEVGNVGGLLEHLQRAPGLGEIIVVDGGSTDGTPDLVVPPARLVHSKAGRGMQLNAGAREGTGDVLFFLHADVVPAVDVAFQLRDAVKAGYVGGNFRLRYPGGGWLGWWLERLNVLYRKLGRYYGDSGIFIRRDVYEKLGSVPEIPIMEDIVFVKRLEASGETAFLPGPVFSSPRRWEGKPFRTMLLWGSMQTMFALGVPPDLLDRFYRTARQRLYKAP